MSIDYVILDQGTFVYARGWGALTDDDVIAHERRVMADPRVRRGFRQLLDYRWVVDDRVGEELLTRLREVHAHAKAKVHGARYAVVAHSAHWFRLGNAYPCDQLGMTCIVFNCPSTAGIWLGVNDIDMADAWSVELPEAFANVDRRAVAAPAAQP